MNRRKFLKYFGIGIISFPVIAERTALFDAVVLAFLFYVLVDNTINHWDVSWWRFVVTSIFGLITGFFLCCRFYHLTHKDKVFGYLED